MHLKYLLLITFFGLFFHTESQAKKVDLQQAEPIAKNFFIEANAKYRSLKDISSPEVINSFTVDNSIHIFNFTEGFVIIAGDDQLNPIIGYSYEGNIKPESAWDSNYASFMKNYCGQVKFAQENRIVQENAQAEWNRLSNRKSLSLTPGRNIEPLLTNNINQTDPYNLLCPYDVDKHTYCPAGCVATAMAMIVYHYRYPIYGKGEKYHKTPKYGTLYANFEETHYNYEAQEDKINPSYPYDMNLIQYHLGISIKMNYSPAGSGSNLISAKNALITHFKYDPSAIIKSKSSQGAEWANVLRANLDDKLPLPFSGAETSGGSGGHAFCCDGYEDDNFHFNFGWGGSGNGFYTLETVNQWPYFQKAIFDLKPIEAYYPNPIKELQLIETMSGTLVDGSGPREDYDDSYKTSFLLQQPETDSVKYYSIKVKELNLGENDTIYFYNGEDENAPIIKKIYGNKIPYSSIKSTSNKMFIKFFPTNTGEGFRLRYSAIVPNYSTVDVFTKQADTLTDKSGRFLYNNNLRYRYYIEPENMGNKKIKIEFKEMDLQEEDFKIHDRIEIQDADGESLAVFTGTQLPPEFITDEQKILLIFSTDGIHRAQGFRAEYSVTTGINDILAENFSVYPNPAKDKITIDLNNISANDLKVSIFNNQGQIVQEQVYSQINSDQIVIENKNKWSGLFFLNIQSEEINETVKVVFE